MCKITPCMVSLCVYLNYYQQNLLFFFSVYKSEHKDMNFNDKKIKKREFYKNKKLFQIDHFDVNKILVSKITIRYKECT